MIDGGDGPDACIKGSIVHDSKDTRLSEVCERVRCAQHSDVIDID